jgi:predicted transcriptional regulator
MNVFESVKCDCCGGSGKREVISHVLLRKARSLSGVSIREMARRLDYSAAYLSDIELGRRGCNPKISAAYQELKPSQK